MTKKAWTAQSLDGLRTALADGERVLASIIEQMNRLGVNSIDVELDYVQRQAIWTAGKLEELSGKWNRIRRELIAQKARQLATELNQAHAAADPIAALDPISLREKVGAPPHADSPPAPPATPVAKEKRRVKGMLRGQEKQEKSREKKGASNVDEAT